MANSRILIASAVVAGVAVTGALWSTRPTPTAPPAASIAGGAPAPAPVREAPRVAAHQPRTEAPAGAAAAATSAADPVAARVRFHPLPEAAQHVVLRMAAPAVLACLASAHLRPSELPPELHGELEVDTAPDGTPHIAAVRIVGGEAAPEEFVRCAEEALHRLAPSLPSGSVGLVVTPPFAGSPLPRAH
jgi:hypothetical protein